MNKIEGMARDAVRERPPSGDLLRTFVAIAESGALTPAAARLGRTQSAISVQLKSLEAEMGAVLFSRHARGMTLTDKGEALLPAARRALAELRRVGSLFDAPLAGRIRVGVPDDYDDGVMERALAAFAVDHPGVRITVASGCAARYSAAIRKGELDVAVLSGAALDADRPGEIRPDEAQRGEVLTVDPIVWAAGGALAPDPSAPLPVAMLDRSCWWREMQLEALARAGRDWTIIYSSESYASVRSAIRAGLAVGAMPLGALEPQMRALGPADGAPALPASARSLLIRPGAPQALAEAMAAAIRKAVRRKA